VIEPLQTFIDRYKSEYDLFPLWDEGGFHIYNNWIGPVDAEIMYCFIREIQPALIVEIGAGMSTQLMAMAVAVNSTPTRMVIIDPEPRHDLPDVVEHIQSRLEDVDLSIFAELHAGDVLSIDSSHVWKAGNDVDLEYHTILPSLRQGVIVHCHDIFLPDGYPSWWEHRGYDEQDHLLQLLESRDWEILWSSHQIQSGDASLLYSAFRSMRTMDYPASFWMKRR
jgi:methyltransferase family protein